MGSHCLSGTKYVLARTCRLHFEKVASSLKKTKNACLKALTYVLIRINKKITQFFTTKIYVSFIKLHFPPLINHLPSETTFPLSNHLFFV